MANRKIILGQTNETKIGYIWTVWIIGKSMKNLQGKTIVLTGASGGIGEQAAIHWLRWVPKCV